MPGVGAGAHYKYEIRGADGGLRLKADPMATAAEMPPRTASTVFESQHPWRDGAWIEARAGARPHAEPVSIYEVHLGSWRWNPRGGQPLAHLPRARRRAGRLRPRHGLHPRRAAAGDGPPVHGLMGLPGDLVLRADADPGDAGRPEGDDRPDPRARRRRDPGLGARPLPARRVRAGPVRRHGAVRARRPPPRRAPRLGHADLQLRPQRGAQLPDGQRALLARRVPRRRHPRGRRRVDALPRLLARGGRVAAQRVRRPRGLRGRSASCAR